ncbi:MAG: hypothetical protein A3G49_06445 [Candidatus Sungbacteria bacterium RIFCSPLOWO2_12_FULL_41_11]|uniref:Uncharacterized protein n=1 Tax=Candidatus Sungbacteria bacterium RIFCSPLOWO2_12_FULL_41_11 TaxID=1802286 RepID=A0A1G2LU91_9BACT|nr:MAG: hypothetical protein A3D41_05895 [Candidatus Sungbacteria bacterium RIFCSPHIGHO2_02_FULL_41_12b]OHA14459.1 MAG: hypothetical protein A3G49_06445 [Candidatus Sungbacteria bacterium RIFCSPLOWO2_12_FULL_41_11]
MIIHRLYLGTWFPRTSIHLKEVFNFLNEREGIKGLDPKKLKKLHDTLGLTDFKLHEEFDADFLNASFQNGEFIITEDGILLIKTANIIESHDHEFSKARTFLLEFYTQKLGPAINYLFSLGAPIPRDIRDIKTVLPFIAVISEAGDENINEIYSSIQERPTSVVKGPEMEIHRSPSLTILRFKNTLPDMIKLESFVKHDIFFREFEFQLEDYLGRHRAFWDEISKIRDSRSLRYKDFPEIRRRLLEIRRTITYVEARLLQMQDILKERFHTIAKDESDFLKKYGLRRFEPLDSAGAYTKHLWEMTREYLEGTITLLHTLYEENTQRELAVIKMTTFAAALTGFFGMNIAFPWDKEWFIIKYDSFAVAILVIGGSIIFYLLLKLAVMNRRFTVGSSENLIIKK